MSSMSDSSTPTQLNNLQNTTIAVSYHRRILFWNRRVSTNRRLAGPGLMEATSGEHRTPLAKIAKNTKTLADHTKNLVDQIVRIEQQIRKPPPSGGKHITPKECANCQWDRFAYSPRLGGTMLALRGNVGWVG